MNNWGTDREVEKPKTLAGQCAAAVLNGEQQYMRLMQLAEWARIDIGRQAPGTDTLFASAAALRELIDLMPKRKPCRRESHEEA